MTSRVQTHDAMVWTGTGAAPFRGKVLIEGERVAAVAPQAEAVAADGAERIERLHEATRRTLAEMRKRGIRIVVGGDYVRHLHSAGCCIVASAVAESRGIDRGEFTKQCTILYGCSRRLARR